MKPSVIGYIAKSVVLVGMRKRHKAYRACDIAFERFHSNHVTFLILMKVGIHLLRLVVPFSCSLWLRLLLYLWPESMPTRYHALATSLLVFASTRYVTWCRYVHDTLPRDEYCH